MKKFFQEIKADFKFKSAGPGQKLTDSVGCVTVPGPEEGVDGREKGLRGGARRRGRGTRRGEEGRPGLGCGEVPGAGMEGRSVGVGMWGGIWGRGLGVGVGRGFGGMV